MDRKIPLKNREDVFVTIDDAVFQKLTEDAYLAGLKLLDNLRAHSEGYAVFQKYDRVKKKYETIYLHKYIAEKFMAKPKVKEKLYVRFVDGDGLNVRLGNLEWVTMATLRRCMKGGTGATGYRGVTQDRGKYRAIIYYGKQVYDTGLHATAEEAALAYNKVSRKLFGETPSLNEVKSDMSKQLKG